MARIVVETGPVTIHLGMLVKNPAADLTHIRTWLDDFTASLGEPFLERFEQVLLESE